MVSGISPSHRLNTESVDSDSSRSRPRRLDDFVDVVADDQLRLMFLCAHPALAADAQVALILRLARRPEDRADSERPSWSLGAAMAQRSSEPNANSTTTMLGVAIPRADRTPGPSSYGPRRHLPHLHRRGTPPHPEEHLREPTLSTEAIRVGQALVELIPGEPEAVGLLALMLLTESRCAARIAADGTMVRISDQDRPNGTRADW